MDDDEAGEGEDAVDEERGGAAAEEAGGEGGVSDEGIVGIGRRVVRVVETSFIF